MIWQVSPEWVGETCFIVAGGPSVLGQDISLLRGRRTIVINSSYELVPWADFLFFGDARWLEVHRTRLSFQQFAGRMVTITQMATRDPRILKLGRSGSLSLDGRSVFVHRTSLTGAINLAVLLGCIDLVLLGVDGKATDGRTHHHEPHPWAQRDDCWDAQGVDLSKLVQPLEGHGITVTNASPGSAYSFWPVCTLEEAIRDSASH